MTTTASDRVLRDALAGASASHRPAPLALDLTPSSHDVEIRTSDARVQRYLRLLYRPADTGRAAVVHEAELEPGPPLQVTFDGTSIAPPEPPAPGDPWADPVYVADQLVRRALARDTAWYSIYGCGIAVGAYAVALLGATNVGKTTLALALAAAGADVYGDELLLLHRASRRLTAVRRPLMVRERSLTLVGGVAFPELVPSCEILNAGTERVVLVEAERIGPSGRTPPPLPLRAAFVLGRSAGEPSARRAAPALLPPRLAVALGDVPCYHLVRGDPAATAACVLQTVQC